MVSRKRDILHERIIYLSDADTWEKARLEWELIRIAEQENTCLCTHNPIFENCYIRNEENGNETIVGNVCIKQFRGDDYTLIFDCVKRISQDPTRQLNLDTIEYAYERQIIDYWEYQFSVGTMRKRKLSWRQEKQRRKIANKIVNLVRGD